MAGEYWASRFFFATVGCSRCFFPKQTGRLRSRREAPGSQTLISATLSGPHREIQLMLLLGRLAKNDQGSKAETG